MRFIKSFERVYLGPNDIVNINEGEIVPKNLLKYKDKLENIGAVKAPSAPEPKPAPSKSKKQES